MPCAPARLCACFSPTTERTILTSPKPRVLIEDWLPVAELGIESRRERGAASALPPLSFLHIWWARRPLVASAAVALAGVMPPWSSKLATAFPESAELRDEQAYRRWLLYLVGIWGDPIAARHAYDTAVASGVRVSNPYTYKQAFRNAIPRADIELLQSVLINTWGELPVIADPTAGGGSIPWAASRLGLPVYANDLNGVAASTLKAGVEIPARHGLSLVPEIKRWGQILVDRVEQRLRTYFPSGPGETVMTYFFANAVPCPRTGNLVPLLPDKWLRKTPGREVAVRLVTSANGSELREPRFEIDHGRRVNRGDADSGTVARGKAVSPYDNLVIDASYIKEIAQAGKMTHVMYAIAVKKPSGDREFRAPSQLDLDAFDAAKTRLTEVREEWIASGVLPSEDVPEGTKTREALNFGLRQWLDFFSPRQALVHGTFGDEFAALVPEVRAALGCSADAVLFELALMQGKALNWNARLSTWNLSRQSMRSVFDAHNFAFKWTFAEFEGAKSLYTWCLSQLLDAYGGIARLLDETGASIDDIDDRLNRQVRVTQGSATNLPLADGSVTHICMDPPYYDNVMYAELADFFYVWEKRTLGRLVPEFFPDELTDKDNEAVANPARFAAMGRRKKELSDLDYESKMTAIFADARRVMRNDGVLSVMFTHKRAEAWDTLGMGLLQAGFTIETSWPVNTEFEHSLHQANMNSAASTIMLVCRKRADREGKLKVYLDDIEADIRQAARDAAKRFQHDGIEGVDLLLSTYGPTLSVISQSWPVYSSTPDEDGRDKLLRPEDALALAREEIVDLRRSRLVGKAAKVDSLTDFVLLAWDTFSAREFPFDTARLLALAVGGLDLETLERARVVSKSAGKVSLLAPRDRLRRNNDRELPGVKPEALTFEYVIDAVDTTLYVAEVDGMPAAKRFLDRHGYTSNAAFVSTLQGLVNAIPRTQVNGIWVVPEAGVLDTLCTLYFDDVKLPAAEEMASLVAGAPSALFEVE